MPRSRNLSGMERSRRSVQKEPHGPAFIAGRGMAIQCVRMKSPFLFKEQIILKSNAEDEGEANDWSIWKTLNVSRKTESKGDGYLRKYPRMAGLKIREGFRIE